MSKDKTYKYNPLQQDKADLNSLGRRYGGCSLEGVPLNVMHELICNCACAAKGLPKDSAAFAYALALSAYSHICENGFIVSLFGEENLGISYSHIMETRYILAANELYLEQGKAYDHLNDYGFAWALDILLKALVMSFTNDSIPTSIDLYRNEYILRVIGENVELLADEDSSEISDNRLLITLCLLNETKIAPSWDMGVSLCEHGCKFIKGFYYDAYENDIDKAAFFIRSCYDCIREIGLISGAVLMYYVVHEVMRFNAGCRSREVLDCSAPDEEVCKDCYFFDITKDGYCAPLIFCDGADESREYLKIDDDEYDIDSEDIDSEDEINDDDLEQCFYFDDEED